MPFNDGTALAVGGKIGRGVILTPEGTAISVSADRVNLTVLADGLSDQFQPLSKKVEVLNDFTLKLAKLNSASVPVYQTIRPISRIACDKLTCIKTEACVINAEPIMYKQKPAVAFVGDTSKNYVLPLLITKHDIRMKPATTSVMEHYPSYLQRTAIAKSFSRLKKPYLKEVRMPKSALVYEPSDQGVKLNTANTFVMDTTSQKLQTVTKLTGATAVIEDYKPPTWGQTGSGSGLKSTRIIAQKGAFFEMYLNFDDCKVNGAVGLPQGMILEASYIKGVPEVSGHYPVSLKLTNDRTVDALVIVPEVPRHL